MTPAEKLQDAVDRLEAVYEAQHARLERELARAYRPDEMPVVPEACVDMSGRPILLDALTAIVNAQTVLAQLA